MSRDGWADEDRRTAAFYAELLGRHGGGARASNWGSERSQALRFAVLAGIGELGGCSLLDIGCGLGALHAWLKERGVAVQYTGIDLSGEVVERARALHPGTKFEVGSVTDTAFPRTPSYDYVFASGIFYLRQGDPQGWMEEAVARMYGACRRGVAFNSLSVHAREKDAGEFYADPLRTLDYCRSLTPWVALHHDYHPADFTIYLRREGAER